jgi:hypothetical protein
MNWRVVRNRKNHSSSPSGLNDLSDPLLGIHNRNHHAADAITMNGKAQNPLHRMKIPGTDYEIDFTKKQSSGVLPPRALIKAIKSWQSFNFNLRASYPDLYIEPATPEKIISLRYHGFLSDRPRDIVVADQKVRVPLDVVHGPEEMIAL